MHELALALTQHHTQTSFSFTHRPFTPKITSHQTCQTRPQPSQKLMLLISSNSQLQEAQNAR